ncbi:MAG: hypothetical protein HBSIN02_24190 [Bacteroidia bacterium]|nr:MAG: hypothetical protein HBSIN02_24190 [Bacteroidia bacterium]
MRFVRSLSLVLFFISSHALGQGKATVVSTSSDGLVIEYSPASYRPSIVSIHGASHVYFAESETALPIGAAALPQESFMVGIPPKGSLKLELLDVRLEKNPSLPPAPVASMELAEGEQKVIVRKFEGELYGRMEAPRPVELAGIHWFRDQRVAVIRINPLAYETTGQLTKYHSLTIRLTFEDPTAAGGTSADPLFEPVYQSLVVNYAQALPWRRSAVSSLELPSTPTLSSYWFVPGTEYLKIKVAREGVFRIPFETVQSLVPPSSDPRTFDLFYKGTKVPIRIIGESDGVFAAGDTIEFWGTSLQDSLGNADEYSDTSTYWLSFSGTGSSRTAFVQPQQVTPDVIITRSNQTLRAEKDSFYYFGDFGLPTNNQTEKVAGEGWYWRRLLAGQSTTIIVTSKNFYRTGNPTFVVRGRLHSPVVQQSTPNHEVEISLNGTPLGTIQFPGNSDTVFALPAPSNLFLEGANTIRVRSIPTGASVNEVFLDWVEAAVMKNLVADGDTLLVVPSEGAPGQVAQFQISGFSGPDISIYRVSALGGLEKRLEGAISGGAGNVSVTYDDTLLAGRAYFVSTESGKNSPAHITKKAFQNLRSNTLGADYLVISGGELLTQALRLAQYRGQQAGFRTLVVDVEDIYDEFNGGHVSPEAIRDFLLAADSLWVPPKPSYVVLFGDANWDYKDNLGTGKNNIVPSYGNPASDSWFVEYPSTPFLPQKNIGRIPVRTFAAAKAFVDMVLAYETEPLSMWNKTFMFMASGFNSTETARFQFFSDGLIDSLTANPIAGRASRLYKTVTNVVEFEQTAEVKRMLDEGAVWINFYGHAGTELWGNGISSAAQLKNREGKRHLVSDISCSTVRFAEPLTDSFSERLLAADEGGAVGYLGSSGFGYESPLRTLAQRIFEGVSRDTIRETGILVLNAKTHLWQVSSGSMLSRQALRQFSFLGDPAMQLRIGRKPDFAVVPGTIVTEPKSPSEADQTVSVAVPILNFGLAGVDSLTIRWTHSREGGPPEVYDRRIFAPRLADTVRLTVPGLRRGGAHNLMLVVDSGNEIPEESEANNASGTSFFVTSGQLQIIKPLYSAVMHPDSVVLVVQNPNIRLSPDLRLVIEIDTSESFSGPSKLTIGDIPLGSVVTKWTVPAGMLDNAADYFWRARVHEGSDSTDWVTSFFRTSQSERHSWAQEGKAFRRNERVEVSADGSMRLLERNIDLEVRSTGFNYGSDVWVYVGGVDVSLGFRNRGYNIAIINQYSGAVEAFAAFDIGAFEGGAPDTTALAQFLENVPEGRWVIAGISDEGAVNKTERINKAFESIGSAAIRSVTFRASWAIIGRKGAPRGSVLEEIQSSGTPITLRDTMHFASIRGTVLTERIGPAARWRRIDWNVDTTTAGTRILLDVVRLYDDGGSDTLKNVIPGDIPIENILPQSVHSIQLAATLQSDSAGLSPLLNAWSVDFDPPAELIVNYQTITLRPDSVLEGEQPFVEGTVSNIGEAPADSVEVAFSVLRNNNYVEYSRVLVPFLAPGASVPFTSAPLSTSGLAGSVPVLVFVDPGRRQRELFSNNNAVSLPLIVRTDTIPPMFQVSFDGLRVLDGDYVRPEPEIRVIIRDNSPLPITDPSNVVFMLDGRRISLGASADSLFEALPGPEKAQVIVRPTLTRGPHTLSLQVLDATGNPADTVDYQLRFNVETSTRLLNVLNFPNPFSHETAFTFHLTGSLPPDEVYLRIYTVSGRLIYERKYYPGQVNIGFNRIVWDGRDQNGDPVANGVYFYKVTAVQGGEKVEVVEKMARMR